eukprot:355645-Chlamydomonas_euryale.AAC.3
MHGQGQNVLAHAGVDEVLAHRQACDVMSMRARACMMLLIHTSEHSNAGLPLSRPKQTSVYEWGHEACANTPDFSLSRKAGKVGRRGGLGDAERENAAKAAVMANLGKAAPLLVEHSTTR